MISHGDIVQAQKASVLDFILEHAEPVDWPRHDLPAKYELGNVLITVEWYGTDYQILDWEVSNV